MAQNQNNLFTKFCLLISFSGILVSFVHSCTPSSSISTSNTTPKSKPSAINSSKTEILQEKTVDIDSSKVLLYLDTTKLGSFCFPIKGKVISPYGKRGSRMHTGTDIKLNRGDEVKAVFDGTVTKASSYYGYGILVVIKHSSDVETYYAHLSKALVRVGDNVKSGEVIGRGGRTGRATTEHLHFELRNQGKALNPEHFFNFNEQYVKTYVLERGYTKSNYQNAKESDKKAVARTYNGEEKFHTIRKGDTLYSLSKKYGTSVDKICQLNNIRKSTVLDIGKKLRVN